MDKNNFNMYAMPTQRILLGLLMLVPGLSKLGGTFGIDTGVSVAGLSVMLSAWPAAMFFAWIVALSEVVFGIAILAKWKMKYTTIPPMIILVVAALMTTISPFNPINLLFHLVAVVGYWTLMAHAKS